MKRAFRLQAGVVRSGDYPSPSNCTAPATSTLITQSTLYACITHPMLSPDFQLLEDCLDLWCRFQRGSTACFVLALALLTARLRVIVDSVSHALPKLIEKCRLEDLNK